MRIGLLLPRGFRVYRKQCKDRWLKVLNCKSDETIKRGGTWAKEEDSKLKDAVEKHNGKNWEATAALIPGRLKQ
jgi:hypothetical protein